MRKLIRSLHILEDTVLVSILISIIFLAVTQIVLRNFQDSGIIWGDSLLRVMVLWIALLGAMIASRMDGHINIDLASRYLSPKWSHRVELIAYLFSALVCGITCYYSIVFVYYEFLDGARAFAAVPAWACQVIIPFAFAIMTIRFVISAIYHLKGIPPELRLMDGLE